MPATKIPATFRQPTGVLAVAVVACFILYFQLKAMGMAAEATGALYAELTVLVIQQVYNLFVPRWPTDEAKKDGAS